MNTRLVLFILSLCIWSQAKLYADDTISLEQAIVIALENNWGITLAENESRIAELNNTLGRAGFLPRVDVTASRSRNVNDTYQKYFNGTEREGNNAVSNSIGTGIALAGPFLMVLICSYKRKNWQNWKQ